MRHFSASSVLIRCRQRYRIGHIPHPSGIRLKYSRVFPGYSSNLYSATEGDLVLKKAAYFLITVLSLFTTCVLQADTIELADGTLLEGDFIGSSNGIIMFDTGAGIEAFPESEVVGIFFSAGVATREDEEEETAVSVTVPAGTRLVIRTIDTIDSSRHSVGHRFRGQLEGALVVNGVTVAPRGAYVHGRITQANQSSNLAGTFTDILLDDQLIPISTGDLDGGASR